LLAHAQNEHDALLAECHALEAKKATSSSHVNAQSGEDLVAFTQRRVDQILARLSENNGKVSELEDSLDDLQGDIARLVSETSTVDTGLAQLRGDLGLAKQSTQKLDAQKEQLTTVEATLKEVLATVDKLNSDLVRATENATKYERETREVEARIEAASVALADKVRRPASRPCSYRDDARIGGHRQPREADSGAQRRRGRHRQGGLRHRTRDGKTPREAYR
jgi:chromosome segregation ATPase